MPARGTLFKDQPITICGVSYPSHKAAAQAHGLSATTFHCRYAAGCRDEQLISRSLNKQEVEVDGIVYPSIGQAVRETGICETSIRRRKGKGQEIGKDHRPHIAVTFAGQQYAAISDLARALCCPESTLRRWLKEGRREAQILNLSEKHRQKTGI